MKTCPRCAEDVKAEARVCRYCGRNLVRVRNRTWFLPVVIPALLLIAGGATIAAFVLTRPERLVFEQLSQSMDPSIERGARISMDPDAYAAVVPERGDIIVFENPNAPPGESGHGEDTVKRVIGLPGETIAQDGGVVFVDGEMLHEPYVARSLDDRTLGPWTVREGHVFVMGDNRLNSNDSRFSLGQVPLDRIVGKVVEVQNPT